MAKTKKLVVNEGFVFEENGDLYINGTVKNDVIKLNLVEELTKFIDAGKFNVKITPFKEKKESNRPVTYKFTCSGCGKIIKSSEDEINVKCNDCDTDFQITD